MVLRGNLQNRWNWTHVGVQGRANQFRHILIYEDNGDVFSLEERFEAIVDLADARVFVDDEEVWTPRLVHFPDAAQQKPGASVFIADHCYEFSSGTQKRHFINHAGR